MLFARRTNYLNKENSDSGKVFSRLVKTLCTKSGRVENILHSHVEIKEN